MGMYTELELSVVLSGLDEVTLSFLKFMNDREYADLEPHESFYLEPKLKTFLECERWDWIHVKLTEAEEGYLLTNNGEVNLKNYKSDIEKFYDIIEPFVLLGEYKSHYEEDWNWFNHITDEYEGEDDHQGWVGWGADLDS